MLPELFLRARVNTCVGEPDRSDLRPPAADILIGARTVKRQTVMQGNKLERWGGEGLGLGGPGELLQGNTM